MPIIYPISIAAYMETCTNVLAFAAEEVVSNNTFTVRVTLKDSSQADQPPALIPGARLPTNCGNHFSRCNLTLLANTTTATSVLLVPLHQGIAQIVYRHVNDTLQLEMHRILPLPSQVMNSCQVTTLLNITEFVDQRQITDIIGSLPHAIGICLGENGAMNARLISISVDFMNASKSFLSVYRSNVFSNIQVASLSTVSNFLFTSRIAECWLDIVRSVTNYIHDGSRIGQFDLTGVEGAYDYTLLREGTDQEFLCDNPRQFVRISDQILIIYCENGSAEINVCDLGGSTVEVTNIRETNNQPYYCSSDMSSFVSVNGRTIMYGNSSLSVVRRNFPLAEDEGVYFGDCILNSDEVLFISTTTRGSTYLFNLSRQDLDEEEAVLLLERGVNSAAFIQHKLYLDGTIILYNNGSSTLLHNVSCRNSIATIDHQHHLSLVVPSERQHPCTCRRPSLVMITDTTTPPPSQMTTTTSGLSIGAIAGIVVAVLLLIVVPTLGVVIYMRRRKFKGVRMHATKFVEVMTINHYVQVLPTCISPSTKQDISMDEKS